ncbi:MAG: 3-dehydroquinate synthase [Candidatus Accumulibacter sp.]|jgi:3-dehydroquinate synthase|nr:3-dehydroquinate synthase [Accumulibacter sp.]
METLNVQLAERTYPIHIGQGLLERADLMTFALRQRRVAVVTNDVVAPLYLRRFTDSLDAAGITSVKIILPDGEGNKNWQTLNRIFDELLTQHCERSTALVALGGGVTGDMAGFAAACYQRGMPFIQVPTTLLAQVDSSVGGKTAINHPRGKNMIGAFYQPSLVLADTDTLKTLPDRELRSGLAEIVKYGLIRDLPFLEWLEAHLERLLRREPDALEYAIYRSCSNKAEIVGADERETGERALLNLGHTFAHAIETGAGYGVWLHGEAVSAGCLMAAELSCRMGLMSADDAQRIEALFSRAGTPVLGPKELPPERYLDLMRNDKKVENGKIRLVLLKKPGDAFVCDYAPPSEIAQAIASRTGGAFPAVPEAPDSR